MSVFVFNQNVKIKSLRKCVGLASKTNLFLTTHYLYENERAQIDSMFSESTYKTFADFLSDEEMAIIDNNSYTSAKMDVDEYITNIKISKNLLVLEKVLKAYRTDKLYILSDGLGIDKSTWEKYGFKYIKCKYYKEPLTPKKWLKNKIKSIPGVMFVKNKLIDKKKKITKTEAFVGYFNNRKYIFIGQLSRIGYRLNIDFVQSDEEARKLEAGDYESGETCTYMTTWHEHWKCNVPDDNKYEVRWAQDGYLPPNYSHKDYFFKPNNVKYYCWDELGTHLFRNQGLPYELIPFRKKLYLPTPIFPNKIRNILIVALGAGDWTALKNRSDDDIMVDAFAKMARRFPDIQFTYRCHPTWVHPNHLGINSINRVIEYFEWLGLSNLKVSSNIPQAASEDGFKLSFSRSSLDDDLKLADFVFGEHSISMIDGAFKGIPFCSVNLTNRRNFFVGINNLGFPMCNTVEEIEKVIDNGMSEEFKRIFLKAIASYNEMTDL